MNGKDNANRLKRRQFLKGAAGVTAAGAALGAWRALHGASTTVSAPVRQKPPHTAAAVYRETPHIRRYYETARL